MYYNTMVETAIGLGLMRGQNKDFENWKKTEECSTIENIFSGLGIDFDDVENEIRTIFEAGMQVQKQKEV